MTKNKAAAALGKLGGIKKTEAKANAARVNGAKGGRPKISDGEIAGSTSVMKGKRFSFKPTGRKLTRYDEITGKPYQIDETELVEDPNGSFGMSTFTCGPYVTNINLSEAKHPLNPKSKTGIKIKKAAKGKSK